MTPSETPAKQPVGRPRVQITPRQVQQLRSRGASWRQIAKALRIGTATAMRLFRTNDGVRPNIQEMSP
jgi:hypothetical protein